MTLKDSYHYYILSRSPLSHCHSHVVQPWVVLLETPDCRKQRSSRDHIFLVVICPLVLQTSTLGRKNNYVDPDTVQ